jgi:flagellar protein FlaG
MIGKVQDIFSAAIVVGAVESAGSATDNAAADNTVNNADTAAAADNGIVSKSQPLQPADQSSSAGSQPKKDKKDKDGSNQPLDEHSVSLITKELNKLMSNINCNLEFSYHKEVNLMSVQMIDKKTQEVLKEIPPEAMIKQMIKSREWLGAFIDKNI